MIKEIIIVATIGFTVGGLSGWYAKGRDVKADQADELKSALSDFKDVAQGSIDGLQKAWENQAKINHDKLVEVSKVRAKDDSHEIEFLEQIKESNRELREIIEGFSMAGDLGACQLTPEFVGLWNKARAAVSERTPANPNRTATRGDEP